MDEYFPGKEYNYGIMKNLIFDLSKLSESFLCEEIYKDNEMQRSLDLLTSIFSRNADIFQNKMESTKRTFRKISKRITINTRMIFTNSLETSLN